METDTILGKRKRQYNCQKVDIIVEVLEIPLGENDKMINNMYSEIERLHTELDDILDFYKVLKGGMKLLCE
jgi:signal transduction histidine kinase